MELDWSTFILEIINFLVLIWILKRFLYKPVLNIITQRRNAIESQTAEAQSLQKNAETLKNQYQNRLKDWETERQQARDNLNRELTHERARQTEALQATLTQIKEQQQIAEELRRADTINEIEQQALLQGAQFATRLLKTAAGPELENRLLTLLLKELAALDPQQILLMQENWNEQPKTAKVRSAFPLQAEQKRQLQTALSKIVGQTVTIDYAETPELLAGLHISIGAWALLANVRDELKGFTEFAHATR